MYRLKYSISNVKDGNMSYKYGVHDTVLENRKRFLERDNFDISNTICMGVEMRDNIVLVNEDYKGRGFLDSNSSVICDALVTNESKLNLFLVVADCLPIIMFDKNKGVLSLVHGGWSNTDLKICKKAVDKMCSSFKTEVSDIQVIIGPGIQKESLVYDSNIFSKIHSDWGEYIREREDGKYNIDNTGYTKAQLLEAGISRDNIYIDYTDVCIDTNYFSHSRDYHNGKEDQGRFCVITSFI